jgi:2-polyprenyl-6-hydroxyphenyl methylase/3-demethylubiquinone-9 3-methyltransferase
MLLPKFEAGWPDSWKLSYRYDQEEVFGQVVHPGYASNYEVRQAYVFDALKKYALPGSRILDIAAAQGNFTLLMAERGYRVAWNDLRAELADYVRLKWEFGDVSYLPGNAFELGLGDFDVVLITEIIEHVAHPDQFLQQVRTLAKPGGLIIMTTPNGGYVRNNLPRFTDCKDPSRFEAVQFKPNSDGHIFLLHRDEVQLLSRQAGLEILDFRLFSNVLTHGHMKTAPLLKIIPKEAVKRIDRLTSAAPFAISRLINTQIGVVFRVPK